MKIDEMIAALYALREKVGGNEEVPMVTTFGENDYIEVSYPIIGDFEDQDGKEFKCAFIGDSGGEEFTQKGIPHYSWKPYTCKVDIDIQKKFDGYIHISEEDLKKIPEPTIVDLSKDTKVNMNKNLHVKMKYAWLEDAIVNDHRDSNENPCIPGYDNEDEESIKWDIDVENGIILNWKNGTTAKTNYKIVDQFEYDYDEFYYDGYVPDFMGIDDKSYGDYVSVTIDENGKIKNWSKQKFMEEHTKIIKEYHNENLD